jgi:hypothetical protein
VIRPALALALVLVALHEATLPAQTPGPVTLALRIAADRRQFRPGEVIPIELTFNSSVPKRFVVDGATYDRSGRLAIDEFRLAPIARVTDPMLDYFGAAAAFIGGGLSSDQTLGGKPFTVRLELNEWFRFDTPGAFTLSVRSNRVRDEAQSTATRRSTLPVDSNSVSFEIVPRDSRWEEGEVARARALLNGQPGDDFRTACRILRFLGTAGAVDELIGLFSDQGCAFDVMAGLVGAPDRAYVVRQLETRLQEPDQAVTQDYLRTLAMLSVYVGQPELRPAQTAANKGRLIANGELKRRPELLESWEQRYAALLASSLPRKTGAARAVSAAEYAAYTRRAESTRTVAPSTDAALARQQLIAAFLDLPESRQRSLLAVDWPTVADSAMLPALRTLAGGSGEVADLALRRLYQLAPDEGRGRILDAIRRPRPGLTLRTLGSLPESTLPDLDEVIARSLEADVTDLGLGLLHRYASPAVAPRMQKRLDSLVGRLACIPQNYALAYFLRVNPRLGIDLVDRALAARSGTGCYQSVLSDVARLRMTPELEARAIAALDDEHPRVVESAINMLGRSGSANAVFGLRSHFDSWSLKWRERAGELRYNPALGVPDQTGAMNAMVESAYLSALGAGRGWLTGAAEITALRELCVTDGCRSSADILLQQAGETTINIARFEAFDDLSARIGQYELDSLTSLTRKLSQYPRGMSFTLRMTGGDAVQRRALTAELTAWANKQGFVVRP